MAIIYNNPLTQGTSGMLGKTVVFRTLRGKTVISNRPAPPRKQSEATEGQQVYALGSFKCFALRQLLPLLTICVSLL